VTGACVLTLHRVVDRPERAHDVSRGSFDRLLDTLTRRGPVSVELARPEPGSFVLTFDDATADHLGVGRQLAERGLQAIFFVPAGLVGRPEHLGEADLRELAAFGHAVGSHAIDHAPLAGLAPEELRAQVAGSKTWLERIVGRPVRFFAPPGGIGHLGLAACLDHAGYEAGRSMRWGFHRTTAQRWRVPCLPVTEYTLRNGWIDQAALRGSLPVAMRAAAAVRAVAPQVVTTRLRRRLLVSR
jgi:hypothetical protein